MTSNILDGLRPLVVPIGDVKQMAGNPRRGDVDSVAKSLKRFGQHRPIVVQQATGEILIGNHTHKAAVKLGWTEIAVLYTDDDRETAVARSLADNRTHDSGKYDNNELASLLAELSEVDSSLSLDAGFQADEIDALLRLTAPKVEEPVVPKPVKADPPKQTVRKPEKQVVETFAYTGEPGESQLLLGDCLSVMSEIPDNTFNSCITDPFGGIAPKGVRTDATGFDADEWKSVPGPAFWSEINRVVRPGGHVAIIASTKSFHRVAVAAEEGGLELRDTLMYLYTTGMTDGIDIGQSVDRLHGGKGQPYFKNANAMGDSEREAWKQADPDNEWYGFSTALKPAWKPILLMRKPPKQSAAKSAEQWGTAVMNIDGCRVGEEERDSITSYRNKPEGDEHGAALGKRSLVTGTTTLGRWPSNAIVDESVALELGQTARYFLCAYASKRERNEGLPPGVENDHPIVRPVALMKWLVRLLNPAGGVVLDPFCGTGTTGVAAVEEGMGFVGIDRNERWVSEIAEHRIAYARSEQMKKVKR